ncbi:type I secretion system protein LssZ [Legionella maioricensis]|uniref:Type I secretion system protein LssZ n=1 Tax=Legionella maioricensis TaxID=2896528 RepID=A0A9X2D276_9GAMM|nr:type I secretion system protein LssZ [Legionella maioricensis]MCL9684974.1 type I secretion system protein LssZ [Legionella maioricensis]MCL9688129.1 type I secretion system protein LssZ [Legionella maioricensis]
MHTLAKVIHCLFPLIALILLIIGVKRNTIYYVISSLWLSLIALLIHYQSSGGQIFGSYFNFLNAAIYTVNLVILFISLIRIISHLSGNSTVFKYTSSLIKSFIVIGSLLVITNLWINAYFIENRMVGTPIMQVALAKKATYCNYRYVFYKVAADGSVLYLCPNHFGLIPAIGRLSINPDFIATQLPMPSKKQMLLQQHKG